MSIQIATLDMVDTLTTIVNDAYRWGEVGILSFDTTAKTSTTSTTSATSTSTTASASSASHTNHPSFFQQPQQQQQQRVTRDEMEEFIIQKEMLVLSLVSVASSMDATTITTTTMTTTTTTTKDQDHQHHQKDTNYDNDNKPQQPQHSTSISTTSSSSSSIIIGCIKVHPIPNQTGTRIAEWGCLAVARDHLGRGYGTLLVQAAEEYILNIMTMTTLDQGDDSHDGTTPTTTMTMTMTTMPVQQKRVVAQLHLLAPTNWHHDHKERLRAWYQRMGYKLANPHHHHHHPHDSTTTCTFETCTLRLVEGSMLADRFGLVTDADLTCYHKVLE